MTSNQMKHIISSKLASLFTVKIVKSNSRLAALYTNGDIYIGKTKVCEYREDKVKFIDNEKEELFNNTIKQNDIITTLLSGFPEHFTTLDVDYIISFIILDKVELDAFDKRIKSAQKNAICFGYINADTFSVVKYKISLDEINKSGRISVVQTKLDEIRAKLTNGMVILNTNLKEVGLV